jgi:hypothetical protein
MCGANIVAGDLDIRRGLAVCSHCSTVLRITAKGTEEYRQALPTAAPPAGVTVRREQPGCLSITAPRTTKALVINRPELGRGVRAGLIITAGITIAVALLSIPFVLLFGKGILSLVIGNLVLTCVPVAFIAVLASILYFTLADKSLPPLRLQNGKIFPSNLGVEPIAAGGICQIYSTATKVLAGNNTKSSDNYFVYALLRDDRRIALIGPVDTPETALYVEETLEAGLGILDLPVYGDKDLPAGKEQTAPVAPELRPGLKLRCDGCGGELTADGEDTRRGYAVCRSCGSLTLLYEPGSNKPILGMPALVPSDSQYLLQTDATGTAILTRNSAVPIVKIAGGRMELSRLTGSQQSIPLDAIVQLGVRTAGKLENAASAGTAIAAGMLKLGNAMAYSGEVDPAKLFRDSLTATNFQIVVKTNDGREHFMLAGIRDASEAFTLMNSIRRAGHLP